MRVVAETDSGYMLHITHRELAQLLGYKSEIDTPFVELDVRIGSSFKIPSMRMSTARQSLATPNPKTRCAEVLTPTNDGIKPSLEFGWPLDAYPSFSLPPHRLEAVLENAEYITSWLDSFRGQEEHFIRRRFPGVPDELANTPIALLMEDRNLMSFAERGNATITLKFLRRYNIQSFADIENIPAKKLLDDPKWHPGYHTWMVEWAKCKGFELPGYPEAVDIKMPTAIPSTHVEYPDTPWWEGVSPFLDPNRTRQERVGEI